MKEASILVHQVKKEFKRYSGCRSQHPATKTKGLPCWEEEKKKEGIQQIFFAGNCNELEHDLFFAYSTRASDPDKIPIALRARVNPFLCTLEPHFSKGHQVSSSGLVSTFLKMHT